MSIEGWNRNRRGGQVTDNDLTVTRIDTLEGKPLAVLVNFTAHPTFMSGEDMLFSGDWPGHLQRTHRVAGRRRRHGDVLQRRRRGPGARRPPRRGRQPLGTGRTIRSRPGHRGLETVANDQDLGRRPVRLSLRTSIALPERTWHPDFMKTGGAEYGLSEKLFKEMLPVLFPAEGRQRFAAVGRFADRRHSGRDGRLAGHEDQARSRPGSPAPKTP